MLYLTVKQGQTLTVHDSNFKIEGIDSVNHGVIVTIDGKKSSFYVGEEPKKVKGTCGTLHLESIAINKRSVKFGLDSEIHLFNRIT